MGFFNNMGTFKEENTSETDEMDFNDGSEDIEDGYVDSDEEDNDEIVETADLNDLFLTDDDIVEEGSSASEPDETEEGDLTLNQLSQNTADSPLHEQIVKDEVANTSEVVVSTPAENKSQDNIDMSFFEPTEEEIKESREEESEDTDEPLEDIPHPSEETVKGVIKDIEKTIKEDIPLKNDGTISFKGGELTLDEPFKFGRVSLYNTKMNSEKHPICANEINIISDGGRSIIIGNIVCDTLNIKVTDKGDLVGIKGDISAKSINLEGNVLIKGNVKAVSFYLDKGVKINGTVTTAYKVEFDESIFN